MLDFDELEELEALAEERDRLSSGQPICLRWLVDVSGWEPSDAEMDFLIDLVPSDNPQQVKKYRYRDDQKRSLVGRLLTHAAVATVLGIPYREISIGRTKGRKPFLCTPHNVDWAPNFNFNVSHEGRYVVLATENLCVVGVDVASPLSQRIGKQSFPDAFACWDTVCSPAERNDIRKQGSEELQSGAFQRHWSLKEAFVKARGDGLAFEPLSRAEFTIGGPLGALEPRVRVDGQARPEWRFFLEERGGYWFSVSRAPPKAIIDAMGQFTRTLKRPILAQDEMERALAAPNPTFVSKSVRDLLPAEALRMYDDLVDVDGARALPSGLCTAVGALHRRRGFALPSGLCTAVGALH